MIVLYDYVYMYDCVLSVYDYDCECVIVYVCDYVLYVLALCHLVDDFLGQWVGNWARV